MNTFWTVLLIILCVLAVGLVVLYFLGRRMQKTQAEQQKQMDAAAQTVSMLIIDKKKLKLKDAGLPAAVLEQVPRFARIAKFPIVKVKVGPRVTSMICDAKIFDRIPVKKTVTATISGLYITAVRAERGTLETPPKKTGPISKLKAKLHK